MKQMRNGLKVTAIALTAVIGVAANSWAADSHHTADTSTQKQSGPMSDKQMNGHGDRKMGPGMQPGMMMQGEMKGPGMMMGRGMMGPEMMAMMHRMMHGNMSGHGERQGLLAPIRPQLNLSIDDVKYALGQRLERHGNNRLKIGDVKAESDDTIIVDIVTVDDSLVRRLKVNRRSGRVQHAE